MVGRKAAEAALFEVPAEQGCSEGPCSSVCAPRAAVPLPTVHGFISSAPSFLCQALLDASRASASSLQHPTVRLRSQARALLHAGVLFGEGSREGVPRSAVDRTVFQSLALIFCSPTSFTLLVLAAVVRVAPRRMTGGFPCNVTHPLGNSRSNESSYWENCLPTSVK